MSTLDYWQRAPRKLTPALVRVAWKKRSRRPVLQACWPNGRRIETSWSFSASDLEKLIRVAEG